VQELGGTQGGDRCIQGSSNIGTLSFPCTVPGLRCRCGVFGKNKFTQIYGYQLKEGKADSKQPLEPAFAKSFVIKGSPPVKTKESHGWTIPNAETIDDFFGYSGKHWTPQEWKRLESTVRQN